MNTTSEKTKTIIYCGLLTALMAICSWIAIPTMVPFTLQTFAVFLAILMLGPRYSAITVTAYLLVGVAGLPVFAGFQAGAGVLAGPLGGYMLGFIPQCILSGLLLKNRKTRTAKLLVLMAGLMVCYALGSLWFSAFYSEETIFSLLIACVAPFLLPDLLKAWLALLLYDRIKVAFRF